MKDLINVIWNMPATEFLGYLVICVFFLIFIYELLTEIRINRVKRFNIK